MQLIHLYWSQVLQWRRETYGGVVVETASFVSQSAIKVRSSYAGS